MTSRALAAASLVAALAGCGAKNTAGAPDMGVRQPVTQWAFTEIGLGSPWAMGPTDLALGKPYDHGSGLAVGDIDGDGHEDIVLLNQCGPTGYFLGHGDGTFTDASARLAMLNDGIRWAVTYGDYDNDGRIDLYVTFVRRPNALLHQNEDGSFTDVAAEKGVAADGHYTGAAFVDVNGDGYLDLMVAAGLQHTTDRLLPADPTTQCPPMYESMPINNPSSALSEPSSLFLNGGAGANFAFTDQAAARGVPMGGSGADARGFSDVTVVDFDKDGAPDLVLSEMYFGRSSLLQNDGTGNFNEVNARYLPRPSLGSACVTAADYDNNGWPDFFMTDMHSDMWQTTSQIDPASFDPAVRYKGPGGPRDGAGDNSSGPLFGNSLWLEHGPQAVEEADLTWQAETFQPWGNTPADYNNDGLVDVFIPSGMSNPVNYWSNMFLVNRGTKFDQMQAQVGFDPPPGGREDPTMRVLGQPYVYAARAAATGDFDENGTMDLVVLNWNHRAYVFRNDMPPGSHWLEVNLVGTAPRDPYGAFVEVKAGGQTYLRWMRSSSGYLSQSTRWVHFGLGATDTIDAVTVKWPDGTSTAVPVPAVDTRITVTHP